MKTLLSGRYELGDEVGKGGMAITYRAHDIVLDRTVAVKVMREQFISDPDFVQRFRREAQAAASLSHENIASVYDSGADGGRHYIVMEYVEGENLEQRLRREGPLDPATAIAIALQVVAALAAAHGRGIVHRDVKPHNILINTEGRVKVTDFGIAKAMSASSQTGTGTIMGSVHYFSPEQARGDAVGPQSDLYSLGIVLFEALTGRRPFEGENPVAVAHRQIYDQPPLPSEYRPHLPSELEGIILKCLEKSLARRYASAAELRGYLEDARERLSSHDGAPQRRRSVSRGRRLRRGAGWLALTVAVIGAGAGTYFYAAGREQPGLVTVPEVAGFDAVSAQRLLADRGLVYRADREGVYAEQAPGLIVRQNPRALARVAPDTAVTVWLSLGPRYVTVPDLARMSQRQAQTMLRQANLEPGEIIEQYDDEVPVGYVISSEPSAREQVDKRTRVALIISRGKPPTTWVPPENGGPDTAEATIAYTVPDDAGAGRVQVRIEVVDDRGKRVLYDAQHMAGDQLPPVKVRYAGRAVVRVLVAGRERWSRVYGAETPGGAGTTSEPPAPAAPPAPAGE
ncbi:MAG TPA: protein kinase [Armatimonadota bacterium]|nr:protein kinase [Armatimonadota bacterium]